MAPYTPIAPLAASCLLTLLESSWAPWVGMQVRAFSRLDQLCVFEIFGLMFGRRVVDFFCLIF